MELEKLETLRQRMNAAVRDCLVRGYEPLVDGLELPDKDDRHVLAAAIRCGAQVIVTANVKDFPQAILRPSGIEAVGPDDFVHDLIDLEAKMVWACDVMLQLERSGLVESVAALRTS